MFNVQWYTTLKNLIFLKKGFEICGNTTTGKRCTWGTNRLFPFLCNERLQGRVNFYRLYSCMFLFRKNETLYTFSGVIICLKNLETECLQNESEILMDSVYWLVMCRWFSKNKHATQLTTNEIACFRFCLIRIQGRVYFYRLYTGMFLIRKKWNFV